MTFLVERLAELRKHSDHLRDLRPRIDNRQTLANDLSLHNDTLFSLLMVAQLVIDIAGELSARRGERFESYGEAIRNLGRDDRFEPKVLRSLEKLPGFRNVVVHEYVGLDLDRVIAALDDLGPIDEFIKTVATIEAAEDRS